MTAAEARNLTNAFNSGTTSTELNAIYSQINTLATSGYSSYLTTIQYDVNIQLLAANGFIVEDVPNKGYLIRW